ncbi:hypothetical protein DSL72_000123 [Monilinia vaccinii-corymbosi]|uniref:3',5'-cyclic-nucleotide phosphodiesterase n=1 Tax=Monilinia vaccinii-corymbosi TaxID=61207 RepID=A0A8A3PA67_9HELO|nr:hypothetical protein DSL72_000123 [Monilinia vaccinii-corymbosi]
MGCIGKEKRNSMADDSSPTEETDTSFQVIILGAGGGPMEDNCTALLVRSKALGWSRGSLLAVDAGVHLSAIDRLLQKYDPLPLERPHTLRYGILSGIELPHKTTAANSAHIARNLVGAHLITHPHLDHISGGIISTACPSSKPRKIAGLPSTIEALKDHIFNDVIWPNLSDEDGGLGLVTFMRLNSGGSAVFGDGVTKGYIEVVEGLGVKSWAVSHGNCVGNFPYHSASPETSKRSSISQRSHPSSFTNETFSQTRALNLSPTFPNRFRVYTSSAFFIRDIASGEEILVWGDVEPDSISSHPRNRQVWIDAAPKVAAGTLKGIFIECSYDDSRPDEMLFGHLSPRYVIEELISLAAEVESYREESAHLKLSRDRSGSSHVRGSCPSPTTIHRAIAVRQQGTPREHGDVRKTSHGASGSKDYALRGVKVVLIHLKEALDDGEDLKDVILRELGEHEKVVKLGCEFVVSERGMCINL